MRKQLVFFILPFMIMACKEKKQHLAYPETSKGEKVEEYFGKQVTDPYQWLEYDNSEETKACVEAQNKVTFDYLSKIPFQEQLKKRLTTLWNYPKISAPSKKKDHFYFYKNTGLQNQSVLYYKVGLEGEEKELLDPNKLSEDGTVSLAMASIRKDNKYLTYGISRGGSDWREFYVRDIQSGKDLSDHLQWIKFSGAAWFEDGFFYNRYPEPKEGEALKGVNEDSKIYYHKVGSPQNEDQLVYEDSKHPKWGFGAQVTDDEKFLVISVTESTSGNALYFKELNKKRAEVVKVVEDFENDFWVVDHINDALYVMTNFEAPRYRLIKIDPQKPEKENWEEIIPQQEGVLTNVSHVGQRLITEYMQDAHSVVKVYSSEGEFLHPLNLPILGSVSGFSGSPEDTYTFYTITSFTTPSQVYKYDIANNKSELYQESKIDFDPNQYTTYQVFYTSKDGTKVPMFITHKKGLKMDGNNPTLLYGYGGFNISLTPAFSVTRLIWLENNGILAIPNLRGGGEYGEEWHKAGTLLQKQNVFDDFISAAEYLQKEGFTSPKKLSIQGGSNGGLLVGAVTNQRPDLFAVALPAVGVMDMLRYHQFTIGRYWATDFGTSEDNEEMFNYLYNYSPLHNINGEADYPAVLVTTADHDDRVVPAHSFKYIANLQALHTGDNPTLIRIATKAGHGAGKPTSMIIEEYADLWAFAFFNMDITPEY